MLFWSTVYAKTFRNKWCLDKNIGLIENGLERGFVNHWLNCVEITGPLSLLLALLLASSSNYDDDDNVRKQLVL